MAKGKKVVKELLTKPLCTRVSQETYDKIVLICGKGKPKAKPSEMMRYWIEQEVMKYGKGKKGS